MTAQQPHHGTLRTKDDIPAPGKTDEPDDPTSNALAMKALTPRKCLLEVQHFL